MTAAFWPKLDPVGYILVFGHKRPIERVFESKEKLFRVTKGRFKKSRRECKENLTALADGRMSRGKYGRNHQFQ